MQKYVKKVLSTEKKLGKKRTLSIKEEEITWQQKTWVNTVEFPSSLEFSKFF